MFVVEALFSFSSLVLQLQNQQQPASSIQQKQQSSQENPIGQINLDTGKRFRSKSQQKQFQNQAGQNQQKHEKKKNQKQQKEQEAAIKYLNFEKGEKILVIQSYESGWWYGHTLSHPSEFGFFPSNYVQVPVKSKPPPPPPQQKPSQDAEDEPLAYDSNENGIDWVQNELKNLKAGPVDSSYYLGIKGYRNVKIDEKNQNILKGNNVKFDVSTGLAKVPIKDQAPAAKSVRQMGYYFDYHQWTEQRNKNPNKKARPDIRKKKEKTLKLKGMD